MAACRNIITRIDPEHRGLKSVERHGWLDHLMDTWWWCTDRTDFYCLSRLSSIEYRYEHWQRIQHTALVMSCRWYLGQYKNIHWSMQGLIQWCFVGMWKAGFHLFLYICFTIYIVIVCFICVWLLSDCNCYPCFLKSFHAVIICHFLFILLTLLT